MRSEPEYVQSDSWFVYCSKLTEYSAQQDITDVGADTSYS